MKITLMISPTKLFFTLFLVILGYFGFSQNLTLIDSLRNQLLKANGEEQFDLLNSIGFEYRYSVPDCTIFYCTQSYELGRRLKLEKDLSKPLSFIGLAYANKGDYKRSIDYHHQAIELAGEQKDTIQLAFGYNNLGRMFFDQGDMVRASDNLIRSKDIFERIQDKSGLAYVYRSLANVYKSQNDYAKALEMSSKAYEFRKQIGDPRTIVSALLELGLVHQGMKNTQLALFSFRQADSVATQINDRVTKAELKMGMAEILFEEKKWDEAFAFANEVQQTVTEQTNQKLFLRAAIIIGKYYYQTKQFNKAIEVLEEILVDAENTGNPSFQRDASFVLAEIYKLKHDPVRSNDYTNKYRILNEKLQNADLSRQIDRLQFQLEIEKKERENEQLKANEARNTATIAKQRFENILLIVIISLISVIAFIAWNSSRKRRIINHKLALQNQHIVVQREEIIDQNEKLSRRNQELSDINHEKDTLMSIVAHDLKSPLNRIVGLAGLLEDEDLPASKKEFLILIKASTRSGLDLITDLLDVNELEQHKGGPLPELFDTGPLFRERLEAVKIAAAGKSITVKGINEIKDQVKSDPDYFNRIFDNLLSNAVKFSPKGSVITVELTEEGRFIKLSVKDQGPGFSPSDKKLLYQKFKKPSARPTSGESSNGLGLAIVKTLIDRLDGTVELISEIGKGSQFIVRIPNLAILKA